MQSFSENYNKVIKLFRNASRRTAAAGLAAVALVVIFAGSNLFNAEGKDQLIPIAKVKRGPVTIKVTEIGELRAQNQATISANNEKQIIWLAPEGTWVEQGDTLVKLEAEKYYIYQSDAKADQLVAQAELNQAISNLESNGPKVESARKSYESLLPLVQKGFIMETEVESARLEYMKLQIQTKSLQAAVDAARANVERAKRNLEQQNRRVRENITLAPRAGLVVYATTGYGDDAKKITVGMTPFEGMDLIYLPDISSMVVDIQVSEVDLAKLKIGLPAEIRLDAYPDTVFSGEVAQIADLAERQVSYITGKTTGAKVFDVTVKVLDRDLRLKPGLTATADIIVRQYEDTLYIPLDAVFLDEKKQTVTFVRENGRNEARPIVIGERNDHVAVIQEGLKETEEVLRRRP
jgi:HlyD family secretion protein